RFADDKVLRNAEHARRGGAVPAAAARPHRDPPRARRRATGAALDATAGLGPGGIAGLAGLSPRPDGPPLASPPWRPRSSSPTSGASRTPRPSPFRTGAST